MTLLNMRQAAKVAGVSVGMLTDVKIASAGQADRPFTGRYTTIERLEVWFAAHPTFMASHINFMSGSRKGRQMNISGAAG